MPLTHCELLPALLPHGQEHCKMRWRVRCRTLEQSAAALARPASRFPWPESPYPVFAGGRVGQKPPSTFHYSFNTSIAVVPEACQGQANTRTARRWRLRCCCASLATYFWEPEPPKKACACGSARRGGWGTVWRDLRMSLGENGSQRRQVWGRKQQDSAGTPKAIRYSGPDPTNSGLGPSVTQVATPKLAPTSPRTSHTRVSFPPLFASRWLPAATDGCST